MAASMRPIGGEQRLVPLQTILFSIQTEASMAPHCSEPVMWTGLNVVAFTGVKQPYGWLGNMSAHPVTYAGKDFRTTEALFQWLRFSDFPNIQEEIRLATSPMSAKLIAKRYKQWLGADVGLYGPADLQRMRTCLRAKLDAHPDLQTALVLTEQRVLIEDVSKRPSATGLFWGARWNTATQSWNGYGWLGRLWMELRGQ